MVHQQRHVALRLAVPRQRVGEALDRHVGDRDQPVELDAEELHQLVPVGRLELGLLRRERCAQGVVDEVERERRCGLPVAQPVQPAQRLDAAIEDVPTALLIHVLFGVAGQGGDDLDLVLRQEVRRVLLPRLEQDRQVAAVDPLPAESVRAAHQVAELIVQLRRSAREVEALDAGVALEQPQHPVRSGPVHHFGALGARLHVAVVAGQVAAPSDVYLERRHGAPPELARARAGQGCVEVVQHRLHWMPRLAGGGAHLCLSVKRKSA